MRLGYILKYVGGEERAGDGARNEGWDLSCLVSQALKRIMMLNQRELNSVSSIGNFGLYMGLIAGMGYERGGVKVSGVVGSLLLGGGYALMSAAVAGGWHWGWIAVAAAIWQHGSCWLDVLSIASSSRNFASNRGVVVGLLKGGNGLSAPLVAIVYSSLSDGVVKEYLMFLAILTASFGLVATYLTSVTPEDQVRPVDTGGFRRFGVGYAILVILIIFLVTAAAAAHNQIQWASIIPLVLYFVGSLFLSMPCQCFASHKKLEDGTWQRISSIGNTVFRRYHHIQYHLLSSSSSSSSSSAAIAALRTHSKQPRYLSTYRPPPSTTTTTTTTSTTSPHDDTHTELSLAPLLRDDVEREGGGDGGEVGSRFGVGELGLEEEEEERLSGESWCDAMLSSEFWYLLVTFLFGTGSGLTLVNNLAQILLASHPHSTPPPSATALVVTIFAVSNTFGRLLWSSLSDLLLRSYSIPRPAWLVAVSLLLALALLAVSTGNHDILQPAVCVAGLAFGGYWAITPAIVSDVWGNRAFATINSTLLLAPALGSFLFSVELASHVYQKHSTSPTKHCRGPQCFQLTFLILAAATAFSSLAAVALTFKLRTLYALASKPPPLSLSKPSHTIQAPPHQALSTDSQDDDDDDADTAEWPVDTPIPIPAAG